MVAMEIPDYEGAELQRKVTYINLIDQRSSSIDSALVK